MKPFANTIEADDSESAGRDIHCSNPVSCPLSRVRAGMAVRIKELSATPEVNLRLREIGFCEKQVIGLVLRQSNLICQVCNSRLALSSQLAQMIIVEPIYGS